MLLDKMKEVCFAVEVCNYANNLSFQRMLIYSMCTKASTTLNLAPGYKGGLCLMLSYCVNGFKYVSLNVLSETSIGSPFSS